MTTVTLPRLLAAAGIGIVYYWVAVLVWGFLGANNPINEMLLDAFVRHERYIVTYRIIISLHDVVVNVLVALPFAAIFRWIPPLRNWTYVLLGAATIVIATYASTNLQGLPLLLRSWNFWLGLAITALSLPVAFALLNRSHSGPAPLRAAHDAA